LWRVFLMSECVMKLQQEISQITNKDEMLKQQKWLDSVKGAFTDFDESVKELNPAQKKEAFRNFYEDYRFFESRENLFHAHNIRTELNMDKFLAGPGVMGSVHALDTMMTNLDTTYKSRRKDYTNNLFSSLNSKDLIDSIKRADPKLRRDISIEAFNLQGGIKGADTGNAHAVETAQALKKVNDVILSDKRNSGIPVRHNDSFFGGSMWHDPTKVASVIFEVWRAFIEPLLDLTKTLGAGFENNIKYKDMWFKSQYESIIGLDDLDLNGQAPKKTSTDGMAQKMLKAKTFIFSNGENVFKYQEKFGEGNLFASQMKYINKSSRELAGYELFGADPENGFGKFKNKAQRAFPDDAKDFKESEININDQFSSIMKPTPAWGTSGRARLAKSLNTVTNVAYLGMTAAKGWMSDPMYSASKMTSQFGGNIFMRYASMLKQQYSYMSKEAADRVMAGIGQSNDIIIGDAFDTILAKNSSSPGDMSKMAGMLMKFTLADRQFGHSHTTSAAIHQIEMGYLSEHAFKDISIETQGVLGLAGIDEKLWEGVIRKSVEDVKGVKWLNVHGLEKLNLTPGQKIKARNSIIQLFGLTVNAGIPGGKIKQRATLKVNDPNSAIGSYQLLMNQYKNFGISHYSVLGGIKNYDPSKQAMHIGKWKLGNKSTIANLGVLSMGIAAASYMGATATDLMQGKEPEDPREPDVFLKHMIKSAAPIIGDLALQFYYMKSHGFDIPSGLAPPAVAMLLDGGKLMKGLYSGNKHAVDAFDFIWDRAPVVNTFWAKRGLDFLLGDPIRETFDPDYLDREAEKLSRHKGLSGDNRHFYLDHSTNALDIFK